MAILSERKGVTMWLRNRGNNEAFASYLLKIFFEETKISFHKITYQAEGNEKFQKFTAWYMKQDRKLQLANYAKYKLNKEQIKAQELENYYNSPLHQYILEHKHIERNVMYKEFKNKMKKEKFNDAYKKSKLKFV